MAGRWGVCVTQAVIAAVLVLWFGAGTVRSGVILSKEEALELAFPGADRVEKRTFFLNTDQVRRVEELSGAKLDSKLFTFYVGVKGERRIGYAAFDVHIVRTLPEAFLILLAPDGSVKNTLLLAFYEPKEYEPPDHWLRQFRGRTLSPDLQVGRRIHGIAGSTLTAWAVARAVRKVLALYQVLVAGGEEP